MKALGTTQVLILLFFAAFAVQAKHSDNEARVRRLRPPGNIRARISVESYEYPVSGLGAPRAGYEICNRDLRKFEAGLEKRGLIPVEKTTCVSVDNSLGSYSPSFTAVSRADLKADMVLGSRFNSLSFCEIERSRMLGKLEKANSVLESSCRRIAIDNPQNLEAEAYQPVIVVLNERAVSPDSPDARAATE